MFSPARDADAGEARIGQHGLADALAEVVARGGIVEGVGDAVLAVRAVGEDVPSEPIHLDAAIVRVVHHRTPERDLVIDRDALYDLLVLQHPGFHHADAPRGEGIERLHASPPWCATHHPARPSDTPAPSRWRGTDACSKA